MTYRQALNECVQALLTLYDKGEAEAIAKRVFEDILHVPYADIITKQTDISTAQQEQLDNTLQRLLQYEPLQYITGIAHFCGLDFKVNKDVLVPRPETEELIDWVKHVYMARPVKVLDIGTGSGCIAITLKKQVPMFKDAEIWACDISAAALDVAKENTRIHNTDIHFVQADILNYRDSPLADIQFDFIVSNPPYIMPEESIEMSDNVLKHEPHTALFTPDEDGLTFYKAIIDFAKDHLTIGGHVFFELNPLTAENVQAIFQDAGFEMTVLHPDMQHKMRFISGTKDLLDGFNLVEFFET